MANADEYKVILMIGDRVATFKEIKEHIKKIDRHHRIGINVETGEKVYIPYDVMFGDVDKEVV